MQALHGPWGMLQYKLDIDDVRTGHAPIDDKAPGPPDRGQGHVGLQLQTGLPLVVFDLGRDWYGSSAEAFAGQEAKEERSEEESHVWWGLVVRRVELGVG